MQTTDQMGLRAIASFRPHPKFPTVIVGELDGKAYVLQPCEHEGGSPGMALFLNPTATNLIEAGL